MTVHEDGADDGGGTKTELKRELEVEDVDGGDARDDDGHGSGKAFEDVVCVLDDHRHNESAAGLEDDQVVDEQVVAVEEAVLIDLGTVIDEAGEEAKGQRQEAQLDVPHPDRDVRALEDFLEVNAGEAREEAGTKGSAEADKAVLVGSGIGLGRVALGQLYQNHPEDEDAEREPLGLAQGLAENRNSEEGGREDLQLIGNLERDKKRGQ